MNSLSKQGLIFAAFVTVVIMWGMLLPGYILTLDMVFTPFFHIGQHVAGDFYNSLPLTYLIRGLYFLMPGWLVEKLILTSMFFLMSYLSFTYLPVPKRVETQVFASLLFTANTFVYVRMLAGQWTHLFAYALLPLFLHLLLRLFETRDAHEKPISRYLSRSVHFACVLAVIAIFSLQIFLMCLMATVLWTLLCLFQTTREKQKNAEVTHVSLLSTSATTLVSLAIFCSYWIIPALLQKASVLSNFTETHWQAFAASAHLFGNSNIAPSSIHSIPVLLNLLALGGFWGERYQWAQYFSWPQANVLFWIGWLGVIVLSLSGLISLFKKFEYRKAIFFIIVAVFCFIFAAGDAATIFQPLNLFLFRNIGFWDGFRDSQKFVAFLALSYAVVAGIGFDMVSTYVKKKYIPLLFFIPLFFGIYVWGGFHGQLKPASFPQPWFQAKKIIEQHPTSKVLILPWQGYFSMNFINNLLVANPAPQFFGPQAVASQNFLLGGIYDHTQSSAYFVLDGAVTGQTSQSPEEVASLLKAQGIDYVLFFQDIRSADPFTYSFLGSSDFQPVLSTEEAVLYTVNAK